MKPLFLLVFLLLAPLAALSQNAKIDSLKRVIEATKVDTVRGRSLCRLCGELKNVGQHEKGLAAGERGLEISLKVSDRKGEGYCLNNLGVIYLSQGDYPLALDYFHRSLKIMDETGNLASEAVCLNNIGNIYASQSDYPRALEYYQRSLKVKEDLGNRAGVAASLNNIADIYYNQGDYTSALDYYQRSCKIEEEIGNWEGVAVSLNNISSIYVNQSDYARALEYYQRSLRISEEIGNPAGIAASLNNIGNIYADEGDYHHALEYYQRSLKTKEELGDRAGVATSHTNIGLIYDVQGDYHRALDYYKRSIAIEEEIGNQAAMSASFCNIGNIYIKLGRLDTAHFYAQEGLKLAQQVGNLEYKHNGAQALYRADSALGNWKGAFEAARLYHIYSDSMKNDEQSKELGRLESKAEYEKQAEIDRLKAEEEKKRERERNAWMMGSAGGGLLLMLVIAFTLFRGRQKEKKANVALRTLNEEIQQQKGEIEAQNTDINTINTELQSTLDEVNKQRQTLEEQHLKIEDSIRYASRIQTAIMPAPEQLIESLPPHFIHYQPRDIVSGDFYWMTQLNGKTFFAAVDCTGHGVPGAFMSVLGSNLLHQIVDENQITEPDVILSELDRRIAATLRQQFGGDSKDGMDLALIVLHEAEANGKRVVEFAGAGRPLWRYAKGEIVEYKSAKYSCGGSQHEDKTYPAHRIEAQTGDRLYIFSDGPVDQFGGPHGRKLGSTQLQRFLAETAASSIEEQGKQFDLYFNDWMKSKKQLDDVLLAGVAL